jgi:type IV pilus assembly protein PilN
MRITLNLATRPFSDVGPALKRLRIAMGVLAVLAIGLGFGLHAFHQKAERARARERTIDDKIAAIARERQGFQDLMRQPINSQVLTHAAALNQLFDEKAFSWTLAMEDLETVLPGGVQVSNLEPIRDKTGLITLHLRVVGPRDRALELVQNLEHSKHFVLPRMVGESAEATGGPGGEQLIPVSASNRINLDLLADYTPPVLNDTKAAPAPEKPAEAAEAADKPSAAPAKAPQKSAKPSSSLVAVPPAHSAAAIPGSAQPNRLLPPGSPNSRSPYAGISRPPSHRRPRPDAGGPQ